MNFIRKGEGVMSRCSFEKLVLYLDKKLDLDTKLELLDHLGSCDTCWETLYQLSKDRDAGLFHYRPYKVEKVPA